MQILKRLGLLLLFIPLYQSCAVSYGFKGIAIDYNKVKTMEIRDFTNQAMLIYAPLAANFNNYLDNYFTRNTKLQFVNENGNLELEGEIIRYELTPLDIKESTSSVGQAEIRAAQTRLTMEVRFRYRDNVNLGNDKEETVSAYRDFSSDQMLNDVEGELTDELTKDIVDQIFNITLSNW